MMMLQRPVLPLRNNSSIELNQNVGVRRPPKRFRKIVFDRIDGCEDLLKKGKGEKRSFWGFRFSRKKSDKISSRKKDNNVEKICGNVKSVMMKNEKKGSNSAFDRVLHDFLQKNPISNLSVKDEANNNIIDEMPMYIPRLHNILPPPRSQEK